MTDLTLTSKYLNALSIRAEREPIGTDISDFSDEFCEGFLAGQVNAIEHLLRERTELTSGQVIEKPTMEELLAQAREDYRTINRLRAALIELIEAAESRVPGDDALWEDAIQDARQALGPQSDEVLE